MSPTDFPYSNDIIGPPEGVDESQVMPVPCYIGQLQGGNMDGAQFIITAWKPSPEEVLQIISGGPIYLMCIGGLPPHTLTTTFPPDLKHT